MDIEEYSKYKQAHTDDAPGLLLKYLKKTDWVNFLDLGCGDGSLLYALNKKGCFSGPKIIYAVDLSENRVNLAKSINKNFKCFVGDACNLGQISDGGIDFLVSSQVVEHVDNDEDMIIEASRVLKRGGIFYLSTVFKKWYGWYFYRCNNKWTLDPTHLREYFIDSQLLDILKKYNFEILETKKTLTYRSVVDFIFKIIKLDKNAYNNGFLNLLRILKIPILGYYNWEIICKKK